MTLNLAQGLGVGGLVLAIGGLRQLQGWMAGHGAIALSPPTQLSWPLEARPPELSTAEYGDLLCQAQAITVKIETPDNQGSGVMVSNQSGKYTVITNEHVILDSDRLIVETPDGRRHSAKLDANAKVGNADLALVEFQSFHIYYPIATLAPGLTIADGSPVLSAGFPSDLDDQGERSLRVTHGKISQVSDKSLNGGYQIGYSNWVPKGMSGGPVLNLRGEVIAINGLHAEPLWGNPYVWDDGTVPSQQLFAMLADSSWAIPAERVLELLSQEK